MRSLIPELLAGSQGRMSILIMNLEQGELTGHVTVERHLVVSIILVSLHRARYSCHGCYCLHRSVVINKFLRLFLYIYSKNDERFVLGNYDYTQGRTIPLLTTMTGFPVATLPTSRKTMEGTATTYEGF